MRTRIYSAILAAAVIWTCITVERVKAFNAVKEYPDYNWIVLDGTNQTYRGWILSNCLIHFRGERNTIIGMRARGSMIYMQCRNSMIASCCFTQDMSDDCWLNSQGSYYSIRAK